MILGCVADDITGASDLALMLSKNGMRVLQILGSPKHEPPSNVDAIVVALKTRTAPVNDAVVLSIDSANWLMEAGAKQLFFKYCSTFDSNIEGNIGPVAEALLDYLGSSFAIVCPGFPKAGRTVYQGHLFVHDQLLAESSMKDHPLTPMRDSNLVRFLGKQCRTDGSVGLIPIDIVESGPRAIQDRMRELQEKEYRFGVVDSFDNRHLMSIGEACSQMALITGGSAVSMGLPRNYRRAGFLPNQPLPLELPKLGGPIAILSGSCSTATQEQLKIISQQIPGLFLDPIALAEGEENYSEILDKVDRNLDRGVILVYSTSSPEKIENIQRTLGKRRADEIIEETFARLTGYLQSREVRNYIVAGGETSAVVAKALGVNQIYIGPEIDTGVPWTVCYEQDAPILLAFKSGNFGEPDFFIRAMEMLN